MAENYEDVVELDDFRASPYPWGEEPGEETIGATDSFEDAMDDDDILGFVEDQLSNCLGEYSDEQSEHLTQSLKYFRCEPRGDEVEGRSQVISPDLQDALEAIVAEIMPAFSGDLIGVFPPRDSQDEQAAMQETKVVNHMLMEESAGFMKLQEGFKTALLQRVGYLKVLWEEKTEVSYETLRSVQPLQLPQVLAGKTPGETVEVVESRASAEDGSLDVTVRRSRPAGSLEVVSIPPEDMRVLSSYTDQTLRQCPFAAHVAKRCKSDLVALGYDVETVKDLAPVTDTTDDIEQVRNRNSDESQYDAPAWQNEEVYVVDSYCDIDVDGDGIAERRRIVTAGGSNKDDAGKVVLEKEPFWGVPIASLVGFIYPHRHQGMSLYDKLKQVQDVKTGFLRQTLDNGFGTNNNRLVVQQGMVNMTDLLTSSPNGVIRARNPDAVKALPISQLGDVGLKMMEYMDKIRRESGGAALDAAANGVQVPRDSSHAAERLFGNLEKLSAMIARTFAESGVSELYVIIHRTLLEFAPEAMEKKIGREWIRTKPEGWQPRHRAAVTLGLTQGERFAQTQTLNGMFELAMRVLDHPKLATLVSAEQVFNMLIDIVRASGLDDPEQYWVDPKSEMGQRAAQQMQQQMQQQQQQQQQQAEMQNKLMLQLQKMQEETDQLRIQMDAQKSVADRQFKYDEMFQGFKEKLLELEVQYKENVSPEKTSAG